jgi:tetratricopeptide (TPR) repeat protein
MIAGSPSRAAVIFRDQVLASPLDAEAHHGLGNAELALGNYPAAQSSFIFALRLRPEDLDSRKALELTDQVLNLDPMRRGLAGQERYQRSIHVLQLVVDQVTPCMTAAHAETAAPLFDSARATLSRRVPAGSQSEAVETNLDTANKLWQAGKADCNPGAVSDDPLQLVLSKSVP